jgi:capsular exopolysaccharide synthesis family protein
VIVGIIAGIMLGLGLAFLVDRFDRRLRDLDEIREIFQRPVLAQVPKDRELGKREWGGGHLSPVVAETFHMLRANLRYSNSREQIESVVVTSALPEEGKTTVSWNLAVAAAGTGNRVLLIETDLRKPDLASHLDVPRAPGLSEFLAGVASFDAVVQQVQAAPASAPSQRGHSVDVITAGRRPPNPTDLLESGQMEDLMWKARDTYDLVVIDTPPTTVVSDAVPLLTRASGVIVVTRLGKSTRKAAESLQQQLVHVGAPTFGVVVNGTSKSGDAYGYGYLTETAEPRPSKGEKSEGDDRPKERKKVVRTKSSRESEQTVPSWVYNRLVVTGEEGALAEFVQRAEGGKDPETGEPVPLDFERHVPSATELVSAPTGDKATATAAPENSDGWRQWNAMWPERNGKPENGKVVYLFASAWSPPQQWLAKASEEHPDLRFALEYVEEFCREAAGARWQAGEQVETWDVDPDTADWVEYEDPNAG